MPQGNVIIFEVRLFYYSWVTILILNFYRNEECLVRKESRRYNGCYLILAGNSKKELRKYIGCERKRERGERERERESVCCVGVYLSVGEKGGERDC